jgi:hypothetical protein
LLEEARRLNPSGRFVGLAAFGKHPGWDDHIEDLGLETEALNFAKLLLYVNGIGGQIDSAPGRNSKRRSSFRGLNTFLSGSVQVKFSSGRMWSSSDGKGRKRYPMVVCLHFAGVPLGWALKQVCLFWLKLEEVASLRLRRRKSVRCLLARELLARAVQLATDEVSTPRFARCFKQDSRRRSTKQARRLLRVLYQVQSQLSGFAPGVFKSGPIPCACSKSASPERH